VENKRAGNPRRIYCANRSVIVKTSTRFTQALNAGFVLIQLLYLMHQFLPNIKIKSYFCLIMQKPTPCKWSLSSNKGVPSVWTMTVIWWFSNLAAWILNYNIIIVIYMQDVNTYIILLTLKLQIVEITFTCILSVRRVISALHHVMKRSCNTIITIPTIWHHLHVKIAWVEFQFLCTHMLLIKFPIGCIDRAGISNWNRKWSVIESCFVILGLLEWNDESVWLDSRKLPTYPSLNPVFCPEVGS